MPTEQQEEVRRVRALMVDAATEVQEARDKKGYEDADARARLAKLEPELNKLTDALIASQQAERELKATVQELEGKHRLIMERMSKAPAPGDLRPS